MKVRYWASLPLVFAGAAYGLPSDYVRPAPRLAQNQHIEAPPEARIAGGASAPIDVDLAPKSIASKTGVKGERITFDFDVSHHLGAEARVVYAFGVIDDRGKVVVPLQKQSINRQGDNVKKKYTFEVPAIESDGFYVIRASVAAKTDGGKSFETETETYWQVSNGKVIQHDSADFFSLSRVSQAVIQ